MPLYRCTCHHALPPVLDPCAHRNWMRHQRPKLSPDAKAWALGIDAATRIRVERALAVEVGGVAR